MKFYFSTVFSFLFLFFLAISCSPTIKLESGQGAKKLQKGDHGIVIYSFSRNIEEKPHYTHYTSVIESTETGKRRMLLLKPHLMIDPNPDKVSDGKEIYFSNDVVPTGHYKLIEFYFQSYPASYYFYTEIPFEVKENEATYLGNFHITPFSGKNLLGGKVKAGGMYTITDEFTNDSVRIYKKYPVLKNHQLKKEVFEEEYPILESLKKK